MPLFKGVPKKDTPDDSGYIVLGRYSRTAVTWARHFDVETPCHGADVEQRAKLLHG